MNHESMQGDDYPLARLGAAIQWLRQQRRITQGALAERAQMAAPHVSRIEAGQVMPNLSTLAKMLRGLESNLAELAVAQRAVQDHEDPVFQVPKDLPLDEQAALLLTATSFHSYLEAVTRRSGRDKSA